MAKVAIGESTDNRAAADSITQSSLPGSRNLAVSVGTVIPVLACKSRLSEERVYQHNVEAFHDDTS